MRRPLIAGNWKMNTNVAEATYLVREMLAELDKITGVDKVLCPPFISLVAIKDMLKGTSIKLGAQNMYFEAKGAYTGEISPHMLAALCDFVIIGHSERRQYFAESDDVIHLKIKAALQFGIRPILCVGESLEENEDGRTESRITVQIQTGLAGIKPTSQLVIAYEPIWAIGTGKAATGKQANATINLIRRTVSDIWGDETAKKIQILYGGSVTGNNIAEFISEAEIDGALVGGSSLKANDFVTIVTQTAINKSRR